MKRASIFFLLAGLVFVGSVTYATYARIDNPSSVTTLTTGGAPTAGSVIFSDGTLYAQDNANFFWDDTNNRLGLATTSPFSELGIESASGTTTVAIGSGTKPSCFQLYTSGGTAYRVFLSDVDGSVTSQAGSCE